MMAWEGVGGQFPRNLSSPVAVGILSDTRNILDEHKGHLYGEK